MTDMQGSAVPDILLFLLLLVTLAVGWWLGRRSLPHVRPIAARASRGAPSRDYFVGLNYLLNDEPDDAIDIFTEFLEMNSGSLETYLALGKLLRRRGKVDRSIIIYQNLLGQNGFSPAEMNEIRIDMVQSYIAAGLLDRAELILEDLQREKGGIKVRALVLSVSIFQLEKDWARGVQAIAELLKVCTSDQRTVFQHVASHFYCEMAETELEREQMTLAREHLRQALDMDKGNPRVSILRGRLEAQSGNHREAVKFYLKVEKQDPAFMAEVFDPLIDSFKRAGKEKALRKFIDKSLERASNTSVLIGLAHYLREEKGQEEAGRFLLERLGRKSSLRLLQTLLAQQQGSAEAVASPESGLLLKVLTEYLDGKPQYQCQNCGFELKTLHWLCPSCSGWGTVRHVKGILGE